jgi:hypothetical protein
MNSLTHIAKIDTINQRLSKFQINTTYFKLFRRKINKKYQTYGVNIFFVLVWKDKKQVLFKEN